MDASAATLDDKAPPPESAVVPTPVDTARPSIEQAITEALAGSASPTAGMVIATPAELPVAEVAEPATIAVEPVQAGLASVLDPAIAIAISSAPVEPESAATAAETTPKSDKPEALAENAAPKPAGLDLQAVRASLVIPGANEKKHAAPAKAAAPKIELPKIDPAKPAAAALTAAAPAKRRKSFGQFVDDYGYQAAAVIALAGFGWIVGANTFDDRSMLTRLRHDLAGFSVKLASLDDRVRKSATAEEMKIANDGIEAINQAVGAVKLGLDSQISETAKNFELLTARVEKVEGVDPQRVDMLSSRIERIEKLLSSQFVTGAIQRGQTETSVVAATPPGNGFQPAPGTSSPLISPSQGFRPGSTRLPTTGYVLRDVYRGIALVESRNGLREVVPGDALPGVGRVQKIERRGRGWVVVTSDGVIDQEEY